MMVEMKVKALVPGFGAKRTLAPILVEEFGFHQAYFEPFCQSCAALLAKPKAAMEVVNDLNGDIVNLARCVQDAALARQLYRRGRRMLMCEKLHNELSQRWKERGRTPAGDTPDLERAMDYLYTSWVGRNGVTGTSSYNQGFAARFTKSGGHAAARWHNAVGSIPAWLARMRSVTVLNRDAFDLISAIQDDDGVVIYLDPPYITKGAEYIHDFPTLAEETTDPATRGHIALARAAARFRRARVVISYYAHPALINLFPPPFWTVRSCPVTKSLASGNSRVKGAVVAPEILIINGPSYAPEHRDTPLFGVN